MKEYDVVIIGSGPAGIGCALSLPPHLKIAIYDLNKYPSGGLMNDGKLTFDKRIGMDTELMPVADDDIEWIRGLFEGLGTWCVRNELKEDMWRERAAQHAVGLLTFDQKHIGTDMSQGVLTYLRKRLDRDRIIDWYLSCAVTNVTSVMRGGVYCYRIDSPNDFCTLAKRVVFATGRSGIAWTRNMLYFHSVQAKSQHYLDVGFRVEMDAVNYSITRDIYDPKFIFKGKDGKIRLRTFCTNPHGRVTVERYDGYSMVNGDALAKSKTNNTNFALLYTINLTEPFTDAVAYGSRLAETTNLLAGGSTKVLAQRMHDFVFKHRSTQMSFLSTDSVVPTMPLHWFTAGDLRLALPSKVVERLLGAITTLDRIVPGVADGNNILYAPEIKYKVVYPTTIGGEVAEGLYVAGDVCGRSRSIVGAFISGKLTGEEITLAVG